MNINPNYNKTETVEWYTPKNIFDNLGIEFDLDPASSENAKNVPAKKIYTIKDNGLEKNWGGVVWLNPPYSRNMNLWLEKFIEHGNGIMLLFSRTDTRWFHEIVCKADVIVFKKGRIAFEKNGLKNNNKAIAANIFVGCGEKAINALKNIDGLYIDLRKI